MFTKAEIKKMDKGFHPSTTHEMGNRKSRRESSYGLHNLRKGSVMKVIGTTRFILFIQKIVCDDGTVKNIEHSVAI